MQEVIYKRQSLWVGVMKSWPHWFTKSEPSIQHSLKQIGALQQQLFISKFELLCAQLELKLARLDAELSGLPEHLVELEQQIAVMLDAPPTLLGCVLCYPFSQECFIYHSCQQQLSRSELKMIQQNLLNYAASGADLEPVVELTLSSYQARLLFTGQEIVVWRLYGTQTLKQKHHHFYQLLDQALQRGLQAWVEQQQKIRGTLLQERREVAAELHDSIAQILGFLRLKSAQLNQQCKQQQQYAELRSTTEELASYTHYAYQQTRELITASRLAYQELDFASALKKVVHEFEHYSGVSFELDNRVPQLKVTAKQSVQLLYIIRESLSNVVRHSHASIAKIRVEHLASGALQLSVEDNGRGLDLSQKRNDSFGLEIMHERAERIGAELYFKANQPQGTCVILKLSAH
jgi:nitrate/nitrite-specific signal transduction histidine kinase